MTKCCYLTKLVSNLATLCYLLSYSIIYDSNLLPSWTIQSFKIDFCCLTEVFNHLRQHSAARAAMIHSFDNHLSQKKAAINCGFSKTVVKKCASTSCDLDLIPTWLYRCFMPAYMDTTNTLISTGILTSFLKIVILRSLFFKKKKIKRLTPETLY